MMHRKKKQEKFIFKILKKNGNAEFERFELLDISEKQLAFKINNDFECSIGDSFFGVVENTLFKTRLEVEGDVFRVGSEIGISLKKEITIPEIMIAHLMAVA